MGHFAAMVSNTDNGDTPTAVALGNSAMKGRHAAGISHPTAVMAHHAVAVTQPIIIALGNSGAALGHAAAMVSHTAAMVSNNAVVAGRTDDVVRHSVDASRPF